MSEIGNYKPNSFKSKEEAAEQERTKRVEKVVTGNVKTKKKSELKKLSDVFIAEDMSNVGNYIVMDVLIPAFKKAVSDIVTNGIDMLLYGSNGRTKKPGNSHYVSYDKMSKRDDRPVESRVRTGYDHREVILDSRGEAEEVLTQMEACIDTYGTVTVADMFDLIGVSSQYTDQKYGWTNLRNAKIVRVRDGYLLDMPKALPIN